VAEPVAWDGSGQTADAVAAKECSDVCRWTLLLSRYVAQNALVTSSAINLDGVVDDTSLNVKMNGVLYGVPLCHYAQGLLSYARVEEYGLTEPALADLGHYFDFAREAP
jgi:hypothetical protein